MDEQDGAAATGAGVTRRVATVIGAAGRVLGVDDVGVMLLDERGELRVLGAGGRSGAVLERAQRRVGAGPGPDAVRRGRPVLVTDLADSPEYAPVRDALLSEEDAPAPRAVPAVPLLLDGDAVGDLDAVRVRPAPRTGADVRAVEVCADAVATVLRQGAADARRAAAPDPPS